MNIKIYIAISIIIYISLAALDLSNQERERESAANTQQGKPPPTIVIIENTHSIADKFLTFSIISFAFYLGITLINSAKEIISRQDEANTYLKQICRKNASDKK